MKITVIGGGPAGRTAAIEAANIGEEVTLIEESKIGGKCLNEGCMVVSGLNDVAKFIKDSQRFKRRGIIDQKTEVNFQNMADGIRDTIGKLRAVNESEIKDAGVEIVKGTGKIEDERVMVEGTEIHHQKLIIATGANANIPPIPGSENAKTYQDILDFKEVPEKLLIIGSGVIATEFANIFSTFGSEVQILCRNQFLSILDEDVKDYVIKNLLKDVQIQENIQINQIDKEGLTSNKGQLSGDVLLATGMKPNSQIVKDKVDLGSKGEILVNKQMRTSQKNIYAAGDVVGGIGTTPVARMEGVVAARNACGIFKEADYSIIPGSISLYYDVAFLNQNHREDVKDKNSMGGSIPGFAGSGSFWNALDGNTGFTKVKVDIESGAIKDVASISPSARTSIAYIAQMMRDNYKTYDFDDFIETHPSTDPIYKLLRLFAKFG